MSRKTYRYGKLQGLEANLRPRGQWQRVIVPSVYAVRPHIRESIINDYEV